MRRVEWNRKSRRPNWAFSSFSSFSLSHNPNQLLDWPTFCLIKKVLETNWEPLCVDGNFKVLNQQQVLVSGDVWKSFFKFILFFSGTFTQRVTCLSAFDHAACRETEQAVNGGGASPPGWKPVSVSPRRRSEGRDVSARENASDDARARRVLIRRRRGSERVEWNASQMSGWRYSPCLRLDWAD